MITLSTDQWNYYRSLHQNALAISKKLAHQEFLMIEVLQNIDHNKVFRYFGFKSLYQYACLALKLSENRAYNFIIVARRAAQIEKLQMALKNKEINLSKAKRISSVINHENASHWLNLAKTSTQRDLERYVAKINPGFVINQGARFISESTLELKAVISVETEQLLKGAQDLLSQSEKRPASLDDTFKAMAMTFLEKKDPVLKAAKVMKKTLKSEAASVACQSELPARQIKQFKTFSQTKQSVRQDTPLKQGNLELSTKIASEKDWSLRPVHQRKPLSTFAKHQVNLRDQGECQAILPNGSPCKDQRWIDIHHIKPLSLGGLDVIENLMTLCRAHHQMEHRQSIGVTT